MGLFENDKEQLDRIEAKLRHVLGELFEIRRREKEIARILRQLVLNESATGFVIFQEEGELIHMITGVPLGGSGSFSATPNGALQSGNVPSWTASDPAAVLTPSADGLSCGVAIPAADTTTSFTLIVSGVNSAGTSISSTSANIPVLPAVPVPATAFDIEQTA